MRPVRRPAYLELAGRAAHPPQKAFDWAELRNIPLIECDPNSDPNNFDGEDSPEALNHVIRFTWLAGGLLTLLLLVVWPLLALPAKVFSQGYFT
jgi:hypothetical protein